MLEWWRDAHFMCKEAGIPFGMLTPILAMIALAVLIVMMAVN